MKKEKDVNSELKVTGIVIFCSDPRVGLWKRIKLELIPTEETFTKVAILGGPISLSNEEALPSEFHVLLAQIHFALATFTNVTKIWIVGHDCKFYKQINNKETFSVVEKEADLGEAVKFLSHHFPGMQITGFFTDDKTPGFKKMT